MTFEAFSESVANDSQPPEGLSQPLLALWQAKRDRWHEAHDTVNDLPDTMGSWIHAYLHRVEGDLGNAAYWYNRARRTPLRTREDLDAEWEELVRANLG